MKKIISLALLIIVLIMTSFNIYKKNVKEGVLKQKIGQMILVGFDGKQLPDTLKKELKKGYAGGIILFDYDVVKGKADRNIESPEQVKSLISELQSYSKIPLFVSVDEEGGRISRLKPTYGFPQNKSHQELGEIDDLKETYNNAKKIAQMLKDLGFNLNFAPVVDVNTNPNNPIIAGLERSFSSDPYKVAKHSEQVIKAHNDNEILTATKHFPGHGSSIADSHKGFADVTNTWDELELIPYKELNKKGLINMVMTSHVFNKNLDENYPATLSRKTLNGILRKQIGYDGVVISDDLQMKAISEHYSMEEAAVLMINAGVDIFCIGNNIAKKKIYPSEVIDMVLDKIKSGQITEDQIEKSYQKVIALKKQYKIIKNPISEKDIRRNFRPKVY